MQFEVKQNVNDFFLNYDFALYIGGIWPTIMHVLLLWNKVLQCLLHVSHFKTISL